MTIGRTFLLWLLGVLIATLVLVSALVLWNEHRALEVELENQARLLARTVALLAAEGGSPEYLRLISTTDLRAGEVRSRDGQVLWRYGPPLDEATALDMSLLRVDESVEVGRGPWGASATVDVVLLVSRGRVDRQFAGSAVRLVTALALTLALALVVGLGLVARVVEPLRGLADRVRAYDAADRPRAAELPHSGILEVRELSEAFDEMTRRLAEQRRSLAASERRYRELFAASPTPLIELDDRMAIHGANAAAVAFLGCEPNQAAGRPVSRYVAGLSDDELASALASAYLAEEAVVEARWLLPGGDEAEVELHVRPTGDDRSPRLLMAIHDLTDRVRRLGERWRRTFDAMVDGVALVGPRGEIVLANQSIQRHLDALAADLEKRSGAAGEWRASSRGRLLACSLSSPAGLGSSILVARDVTEAARAEARLREADKMQAVATLASGVAHDFNNLLAAILLHVRWLERAPEAVAEAAAAIRELAEEGSEVVRELLLFARRESTPPRALDLAALLATHESVLRHLLPPGVEFRLAVSDEVVPVVGNPVALRRMVTNLVANAGDAMRERGGRVEVALRRDAATVQLEVSDNGPGIPLEHRDRLFEPFFSSHRHGRGSGLGLAVVYAIVTEHGGEIELDERAAAGARFVVRLPAAAAAEIEPSQPEAAAPEGVVAARVLLVDDDGREATRIMECLAGAGLQVRHAPTLADAEEIARAWRPEAVVAAAGAPDGAPAAWIASCGLPAVILGSSPERGTAPPGAILLERTAAPEAVLAALRRITLNVER